MRPERARTAQAALHLVKHQQRADLVAQRAQALEELGVGGAAAALALHGLGEEGGGAAGAGQLAHGGQVAVGREAHARHDGLKRLAVPLLLDTNMKGDTRSESKSACANNLTPERTAGETRAIAPRLPGERQRAERAAVEAVLEGDE